MRDEEAENHGRAGDGDDDDGGGQLRSGLAADGALRWAAADLTGPLRTACRGQDLSPLAAAALGRCLTAAVLLLRMAAKTPTRLVLELAGDGPLGKVLAEVRSEGSVRGMVGAPRADLPARPDGALDVEGGIGTGLLKVWRLFRGNSYQSHVELEAGGVGMALAHYLRQSEQTRSAALLGVLAVPDGIAAAGGILVEVMPGAAEAAVLGLEANLEAPCPGPGPSAGPGRLLAEDGIDGLLGHTLRGLEAVTVERAPLDYRCGCSDGRIGRYVESLAENERAELTQADGWLEAECVFCGALYRFGPGRLTPEVVN